MHIDPYVTDAYNALIFGHKWWTYLPKDLYEFKSDWTCDNSCSDRKASDIYGAEAWYHSIYPQMRLEKILSAFKFSVICLSVLKKTLLLNYSCYWGIHLHFINVIISFRDRMFYGDFIKSGLQNPHETIYMPHYIPHAGKEVESVFVERTNLLFLV